ncbi:MAG: UDP-N-acetyl glucosamine 2-epimerase, partial [Colwellia sp.]|nr:UDP-N-acetyl glucosamine 2-epimerase [Colwellia sp.]
MVVKFTPFINQVSILFLASTYPFPWVYPLRNIIDPLGYHDSINLTMNSRFVLTDSGGIQEETTFLNIPCLTL